MSKDIWHTADVKPKLLKTFVYKTDKGHIGTSKLPTDSGWNPVLLPEFYSMNDFEVAERITKWCYLNDLLALETELERTRKALDVAVDALKDTKGYLYGDYRNTIWDLHKTIRQTLEQITALEQKDK